VVVNQIQGHSNSAIIEHYRGMNFTDSKRFVLSPKLALNNFVDIRKDIYTSSIPDILQIFPDLIY
jgi:hypothetical protein